MIEAFWILFVGSMAFAFGRSFLIWSALTYIVGWPMLIVLFLFGPKPKTWERRAEFIQSVVDKIDSMLKPKEYEDFDNVDDLFKQLEKNRG
jgi:hypothetical protein